MMPPRPLVREHSASRPFAQEGHAAEAAQLGTSADMSGRRTNEAADAHATAIAARDAKPTAAAASAASEEDVKTQAHRNEVAARAEADGGGRRGGGGGGRGGGGGGTRRSRIQHFRLIGTG